MSKSEFVKTYVEPMLKAIDMGIVSAEYVENEDMYRDEHYTLHFNEEVQVTFKSGTVWTANVTCDSNMAIIKDIASQILSNL